MLNGDDETRVITATAREERRVSDVAAGSRVGRYIVLSELARGGMGQVLVAYDPQLDRRIALKLIQYRTEDFDNPHDMRLLREAQALARVSHPNVVNVFDVGIHEGHIFLAMEMVNGIDLCEWLKQDRSVAAIINIFTQAARGLAAVHGAGLIHRDFKPSNVLLGDDGRVRVLDFGLARATRVKDDVAAPSLATEMSSLLTPITRQGELTGTIGYLAPELLEGKASTPAVDQFAFGVSLYEALFRARPFEAGKLGEYIEAVRRGLSPRADKKVAPAYVRCLAKCLAFSPADRFASMDDVVRALASDPYRARKRLLSITAAAAVVVGVCAWAGGKEYRRREHCRAEVQALDADFDATRRLAIAERFSRIGSEQGAGVYRAIDRQLEAEIARWRALTASTCDDMTRRAPTAPITQLRHGCLERQADAIREFLVLLDAAEPAMVPHVPQMARQLASANCGSEGVLLWRTADLVPEANQQDARQLRRELIRARGALQAGQHERAERLAEEVIARAQTLGLRGFEAEGLYELGVSRANADPEAGASVLKRAFLLAQSEGIDASSISIAEDLIQVLTRLGKITDAEWVHRWVQTIGTRMGRHPALEFALNSAAEPLLMRAEDKAPLIAQAQRQLELAKQLWPDDWSLQIVLRQHLSLALWIDSQLEASNLLDVETLRLAEDHSLATTHVRMRAFADISTGAFALGDSERAVAYAKEVVAIAQREYADDAMEQASALSILAEALVDREPTSALEALQSSERLLEQTKLTAEKLQLQTLFGAALLALHRSREALDHCEKARAFMQSLENAEPRLQRLVNKCVAEAHFAAGHEAEARAYLRVAQSLPRSHTPRARVELALLQAQLARAAQDREGARRALTTALDELRPFPKLVHLQERAAELLRSLDSTAKQPQRREHAEREKHE